MERWDGSRISWTSCPLDDLCMRPQGQAGGGSAAVPLSPPGDEEGPGGLLPTGLEGCLQRAPCRIPQLPTARRAWVRTMPGNRSRRPAKDFLGMGLYQGCSGTFRFMRDTDHPSSSHCKTKVCGWACKDVSACPVYKIPVFWTSLNWVAVHSRHNVGMNLVTRDGVPCC